MKGERKGANTILIHFEEGDEIDPEDSQIRKAVKMVLDAVARIDDPEGEYVLDVFFGEGDDEGYEHYRSEPVDATPIQKASGDAVQTGTPPPVTSHHAVAS